MSKLRLLLLAFLSGGLALAVACGDLEEDCDPVEDAGCECTDSEGETCDPDDGDDDCVCESPDDENNGENNNTPDENNNTPDENNNTPGENNNTPDENNSAPGYYYLMVEDQTSPVGGEYPGIDIDAIELTKAEDGSVHYASGIEPDLTVIGVPDSTGNSAQDPSALLGPADTGCEIQTDKFVSLGGKDAGGRVVVNFNTSAESVAIENGDTIKIQELGSTFCPNKTYDDDPANVLVSTSSSDLSSFKTLGTVGNGDFTITVSGL